jgi:hypothetical protein
MRFMGFLGSGQIKIQITTSMCHSRFHRNDMLKIVIEFQTEPLWIFEMWNVGNM